MNPFFSVFASKPFAWKMRRVLERIPLHVQPHQTHLINGYRNKIKQAEKFSSCQITSAAATFYLLHISKLETRSTFIYQTFRKLCQAVFFDVSTFWIRSGGINGWIFGFEKKESCCRFVSSSRNILLILGEFFSCHFDLWVFSWHLRK